MRGWKYEGYRHSLAARGIKTSLIRKSLAEINFNIPDGWSDEEKSDINDKISDLIKKKTEKIRAERAGKVFSEVRVGGFVLKNIKEYEPGFFSGSVYAEGKENPWDSCTHYSSSYYSPITFDDFIESFKLEIEREEFLEKFRKSEREFEEWRKKNE